MTGFLLKPREAFQDFFIHDLPLSVIGRLRRIVRNIPLRRTTGLTHEVLA